MSDDVVKIEEALGICKWQTASHSGAKNMVPGAM